MAKSGFRGWHERGYLPHLDTPDTTQFVTFNLADALAPAVLARMIEKADPKERQQLLQRELDKHHGACWLRRPDLALLVEQSLRHFDGQRYGLRAWVVMGNHVHAVLHVETIPLSRIVGDWKSFTSHKANKLLNRTGRFWAEDYFDTFVRDTDHEMRLIQYIERNPCKAALVLDPKEWPWSSARLRDEYGRLKRPDCRRAAPVSGAAATPTPNA
jgi:REP element-mobilizing transposase RayT